MAIPLMVAATIVLILRIWCSKKLCPWYLAPIMEFQAFYSMIHFNQIKVFYVISARARRSKDRANICNSMAGRYKPIAHGYGHAKHADQVTAAEGSHLSGT